MGKVVNNLLGGIFGGAPKAQVPEPVKTAPIEQTEEQKKKAKTARSALYATQGGVVGEELAPAQVGKRPSLLGN